MAKRIAWLCPIKLNRSWCIQNMELSNIMSYVTEENLRNLLEQFRSFGPLPGILLTFMKSFIPRCRRSSSSASMPLYMGCGWGSSIPGSA